MSKLKPFNAKALEIVRVGIQIGRFANESDFCAQVGIRRQNLGRIKRGEGSFTVEQLIALAKITGASLDVIAGLKPAKHPPRTALSLVEELHDMLKEKATTGK